MKRNGLCAVIALALATAGMTSVAYAQNTDAATTTTSTSTTATTGNYTAGGWYIVPRIGLMVPDRDREVKAAPFVGLGVGAWVSPKFTVDFELTYDNTKFKSSAPHSGRKWITFGADVAGRYYLDDPSEQWRPYVMAGVGMWRHQTGGNSGWGPGATVGVGVLYNVNSRIAVRGEIAARYYHDKNSAIYAGLAGQNYPGGPRQEWLDELASIGLVINMNPPAPPPPPAAPPPPPPATPPPPPPQHVVIDLRGVNFKFDRPKKGESNIGPTLKPPASDSLAILNQAVDTLNRYPQVQIEIDGYTDSIGTDQYNQGLSERRAHIVADYLTSHGVDASRITSIQGFGENDPVDTNKTAAGRQRNRRVEFKVEQQNQGGSM